MLVDQAQADRVSLTRGRLLVQALASAQRVGRSNVPRSSSDFDRNIGANDACISEVTGTRAVAVASRTSSPCRLNAAA